MKNMTLHKIAIITIHSARPCLKPLYPRPRIFWISLFPFKACSLADVGQNRVESSLIRF